MKSIIQAKIITKEQLRENVYQFTIESDKLSKAAKPGQFIDIKCSDTNGLILRRPISISQIISPNLISFIFEVKGKGTTELSHKNVGEYLDVLGPLGNGFDISGKYKNVAVVGGGIGIFPLIGLLEGIKSNKISFLGFRNKSFMLLLDKFKSISNEVQIATDDGSFGHHGLVTELLEVKIKEGKIDIIYACGPKPMLGAVQKLAEKYNVPCQLSLEERMGCGVGACLGCACKIGTDDDWNYKHVCVDGPVFWSSEVIFND